MARISDLLAAGPTFSLEFGPPRDADARRRLFGALDRLRPLDPHFTSVTYGALGSTRDETHEIVDHIRADLGLTVMPHLTCVAHTRDELGRIVAGYRDEGIQNLLALGGDPPVEGTYATDFAYASELIALVRELGDFSIGVAAFPEGHPRSPDLETDRKHLAAKLREADFGITQFFFTADDYFRMIDDLAALGVDTPVIPSLMLFRFWGQLERMATTNGTAIPHRLADAIHAAGDDGSEVRKIAIDECTRLGSELLDAGVPGLHVYTLNFSDSALELWANLGLSDRRPTTN